MNTLPKICLTCLSTPDEKAHDLDETIPENLKIIEILYKIVPLLLESQELSLPKWICAECFNKLRISYNFRKQCIESLKKLRSEKGLKYCQQNVFKQEVVDVAAEECNDDEVFSTKTLQESKKDKEIAFEEVMVSLTETEDDVNMLRNLSESDEDGISDASQNNVIENENPLTEQQKDQCEICKQVFKNCQGLSMHMAKVHFKRYQYNCDQCDRGFDNEDYYTKHRNRHLGIKTFNCPQCNKAFDANSTLNQHLISHSNETPYLCTVCGKGFSRSGNLKQHIIRHGEEKPFKCSICSKSFKGLPEKIKHEATHNTEKRYRCHICGIHLASAASIAHHKLVHTGERPFKCDQCDKCFNSLTNMKRHKRLHTGEKPYECQYCSKTFCQSNDLKKHTSRVHKNEESNDNEELGLDNSTNEENLRDINEGDDEKTKYEINAHDEDVGDDNDMKDFLFESENLKKVEAYQSEIEEDSSNKKLENYENETENVSLEPTLSQKELTTLAANQCKLCHRIFKNTQGLVAHNVKTHLKKHLYNCDKCGRGFDSEEFYIRHYNLHLGIKPFPCTECDKAFVTRTILKQHLITHSNDAIHSCPVCGQRFRRKGILKLHYQRKHSSKKLFKCLYCSKTFSQIRDLKWHTKRIHKHEKFEEDGFPWLKNHVKLEIQQDESKDDAKEIQLYCDDKNTKESQMENGEVSKIPVEKIEDSKDDLLENNNEYKNELLEEPNRGMHSQPNQCKICKQIFKNSLGLAMHKTKVHLKIYQYNCDQCDRGFDNEENYTKHRNRHLGIKTYKCPYCDKAFEANCVLNQHLITHTKETPYLCTICGKSFSRSGNLKQHILRHGDEKPFKCSVCPKTFKCMPDHLIHEARHRGEKRFECEICGIHLASSTSMTHHKLVHSGEKPYECDQCGKCFNSMSNMRSHRRIHTGEKPYSCKYCHNKFRQSNDRNKHERRVHKKEMGEIKSNEDKEKEKLEA